MTELSMHKKTGRAGRVAGRILVCFLTFVVITIATLYLCGALICSGKYERAEKVFVTTILETGAMKFVASIYLSEAEISAIVEENSMKELNDTVDENMISVKKPDTVYIENISEMSGGSITVSKAVTVKDPLRDPDGDGIDIFEVAGRTFYGTMMVVYDPTRLSVAAKYPWGKTGQTLDRFASDTGAIAAINGGLYNESGNSGGTPYGVVVANGEILRNRPQEVTGLVLIGLTEDGVLVIQNLAGMNDSDVTSYVKEHKIANAVSFQEEASDKNNHFVQLVINGNAREMNGMGSGLNPRTAIGQRADGALLLFVTDGRGASGHLGASASDLIEVMKQYGAVNAANLDGGSSSCMYYNGEYLMNSVTFYYANSSWNMPLALVVK